MYKKIKVFCGPNTYDFKKLYFEEINEYLVGVDSGLEYLLNIDKQIDLAVGDFDSINSSSFEKIKEKCKEIIKLEKDKNMTDIAFALDYIYNNMDYDQIEVYGGISGRIDHFLANLNLISKYEFSMRDDYHYIYFLKKGKHEINNFKKYVSFFALEDVYGLTMKGFKFNLDSYYLSTNDSLCVSNEGSGVIEFTKGKLLVIMSDDRR
ncbi:MAG: thiamine diphosphokinase [Candidatus Izemoplasmatales bacterium]|nr:thiamine diphosphokinase [Candidatus Izemoplasmatales bacterium]MDY0139544.1 thiamine diphosphokinase [Candidatus Izemoplasmatales bacterium]